MISRIRTLQKSSWGLLFAGLLAFSFSGAAHAGEDAKARAKIHFSAGKTFYREARYQDAIREFQDAYAYDPNPKLLFNIAQAYEKMGDISGALRTYRDYVRALPKSAAERTEIGIAVKNLEVALAAKGLSQVAIYSTPNGARVEIDDKSVGATPAAQELPPGQHTLRVTMKGRKTVERTFGLSSGRSLDIDIHLESGSGTVQAPHIGEAPVLVQLPDPPPPKVVVAPEPIPAEPAPIPAPESAAARPGRLARIRWPTWTCLGVAAALAGTGAGLQMSKQTYEHQADSTDIQVDYANDLNQAQTLATASRITFGASAGLGALGLVLVGFDLAGSP